MHYQLKIAKDLYFNLIPFVENHLAIFSRAFLDKLLPENNGTGAGIRAFYQRLSDHLTNKDAAVNSKLYIFAATQNPFSEDSPSTAKIEMICTATVALDKKFSTHVGIERLKTETIHKNLSTMVHSFCAAMTKYLHPGIELMIFSPAPAMRDILYKALLAKQWEKSIAVRWSYTAIDEHLDHETEEPINYSEIIRRYEASPRSKHLAATYIIAKQQFDAGQHVVVKIERDPLMFHYNLLDGTSLTIAGYPDWFINIFQNRGGTEAQQTIIALDAMIKLHDLDIAALEVVGDDPYTAGDMHLAATT